VTAPRDHAAGPVPLYLIPQVLSKEIHRLRGAVAEIRITRTSGHRYIIRIRVREGGRA